MAGKKESLLGLVKELEDVRGFLFDMDGLIFDTERLFMEQLALVMNDYGYELTREIYCGTCGMGGQVLVDYMNSYYGMDYPIQEISEKVHDRIAVIRNSVGLTVKPEIREVLQYLSEQGIPCAVASSTDSRMVQQNLEKAGLLQYFEAVVGGDMVSKAKPNPDIFLLAAKGLGVETADCVVLEDSESGCVAGARAGCRVICVPDLKYPKEEVQGHITYIIEK